eukprot:3761728-Rhodomonas_salina.1
MEEGNSNHLISGAVRASCKQACSAPAYPHFSQQFLKRSDLCRCLWTERLSMAPTDTEWARTVPKVRAW